MILANDAARIAWAADELEGAFRLAQRRDADEIIAAIDPTVAEVVEWDDFDWCEIGNLLGVPTPVGTRNAVLDLLGGKS